VYRYPVVRWRWKVDNVYAQGNLLEKAGDDYPLRVYVMFKYDPAKASFGEQVQYGLAKWCTVPILPTAALIISGRTATRSRASIPALYGQGRLLVLRAGSNDAGKWLEEKVNILDDYRKAFGSEPPTTASIAIMNDSDNTGEAATSSMDYIRVEEDQK